MKRRHVAYVQTEKKHITINHLLVIYHVALIISVVEKVLQSEHVDLGLLK